MIIVIMMIMIIMIIMMIMMIIIILYRSGTGACFFCIIGFICPKNYFTVFGVQYHDQKMGEKLYRSVKFVPERTRKLRKHKVVPERVPERVFLHIQACMPKDLFYCSISSSFWMLRYMLWYSFMLS